MTKECPKFKDDRIIDGKIRKVIVDIIGDIVNRNPTKEELKDCKKYPGRRQSVILTLSYKEEYLLEFIRYFCHKEGRVPRAADFIDNKYPSFNVYKETFGTWNNAIIKAGLQPNRTGPTGYTDRELLEAHIRFYEENRRSPTAAEFINNLAYPGFLTYQRFEGWNNSLKILGLDIDSMIYYGIIENNIQKGRLGEILVKNHFSENNKVIDLAGENPSKHICDGIDPDGHYYDVKTTESREDKFKFSLTNENIDKIEYLYCLAFNEKFSELLYAWRIPISDFMEKMGHCITIGIKNTYTFNIENMKQYDITKKIMPIFEEWKNCKKWTNEEIIAEAKRKLETYVGMKN